WRSQPQPRPAQSARAPLWPPSAARAPKVRGAGVRDVSSRYLYKVNGQRGTLTRGGCSVSVEPECGRLFARRSVAVDASQLQGVRLGERVDQRIELAFQHAVEVVQGEANAMV